MEQRMCPVDMISVCSAEGDLRPLRLRVADESEEQVRYEIREIVSTKEIPYVGVEAKIYLCRATAWNRSWILELKYMIRSHTWYLMRKIRG